MLMVTADEFRRWLAYETEAHQKVLRALGAVPPRKRATPEFRKALDLFAHVIAARQLWLDRFGVTQPEPPEDLFAKASDLADVEQRCEEVYGVWREYMEKLEDADLGRVFEYTATEGGRFRSVVTDILIQLFGHSWYHRGQIAALVRSLEETPAETDFVFWTRERVD
jgi:uncharacterized damage-inducible protein DinB